VGSDGVEVDGAEIDSAGSGSGSGSALLLGGSLYEHSAVGNHNLFRNVTISRPNCLDFLDDVHSSSNTSEHDVRIVQPRSFRRAEEELTAIRVLSRIRHRQNARARMFEFEVFVVELVSIDRFSTRTVVIRKVSALAHETGNHAVEARVFVTKPFLTGAQRAEVLRGLWYDVIAESHFNSTRRTSADRNVEETLEECCCSSHGSEKLDLSS